ncbi:glycosyltransferase [Metapseudomonas otitidis]|uniref:glycosyltransferase n=1 Tax=Metapseudomonas otitidis TaxID=319939 RepID=UPI000D1C1602|nr:glycosyltransferase [Pseudomonas otitidis]
MSQPVRALITQLWPKNIPLLERYLSENEPRTLITFQGCLTPELEAMVQRHGGELVVIDPLLDQAMPSAQAEFDQRQALAFSDTVRQDLRPDLEAAGLEWDGWEATLKDVAARTLPVSFALVDALDRMAATYEVELVAVNEDWMFGSKTLVAWAKARGIPSLHIEHNPTLCYPYTVHDQQNSDLMVVWSEDSRRLYGDAGFDPERLHVLGLPQFDSLFEAREERASARAALCQELGLDAARPIVVLGTTLLAEHSLPPELAIDEQVLRAYLEAVRALGGEAQVIIKGRRPQGRFGPEQVQLLAAQYGLGANDYRYADGAPLPFLLSADVLVAVDSGLQVEAMLVGTPALNLMTETGFFYGPGLVPAQGVDTVGADELADAIRRLLTDDVHRETMRARAKACVEALPRNSTATIAAFMGRMALPEPRRLLASDQLQDWLDSGTPKGPALARILDSLATQQPRPPRLAVMVLDRHGDADAVSATLDSLAANLYPHVVPVLLSTAGLSAPPGVVGLGVSEGEQLQAINAWAAEADVDWLQVVEAGVTFTAGGLLAMVRRLERLEGCRAVYGDEFQRAPSGARGACFKPDFNLDLLLSFPLSLAPRWFFRREVFLAEGGFDPIFVEAPELELLLRLVEGDGLQGLEHVDEVLLSAPVPVLQANPYEQVAIERHLEKRGFQARVESPMPRRYHIHYGHPQQPRVSIVVAVRDHLPLLQRCVETLLEHTRYPNYELLLVDCESQDAATLSWLEGVEGLQSEQVKVWRFAGPFNFSAMVNAVAMTVESEYLLLLGHDVEIVQPEWLDELVNQAQRPEVGVVGAKVLDAMNSVEQAGIVLGLHDVAGRAFVGEPFEAPGYLNRLQVTQNYSAVGSACLMVRREAYVAVGGMDEAKLSAFYGDVDLCLRIRASGLLNVWTPHSVVRRDGIDLPILAIEGALPRQAALKAEREEMLQRWLPVLANDPSYNRNLSLAGSGFSFEYGERRVSDPLLPQVLCYPADITGCGHYRVRQPLAALKAAGWAEGMASGVHLSPVELERFQATSIVFQRQIMEPQIEGMREVKALSSVFKVYELDDYLPNLPLKSVHRDTMPKDILRSLRQAVALTDRFVVSTEPLAEALRDLHGDIRVVPNFLPEHWWGNLRSQRRRDRKPRVGWAGGSSHLGDLELITDLVKALKDEVEWVFFGMCPERIRPYIHEFHGGVPIEQYPALLASLDLDLALAPLEPNLFNECKSNLRLLEYGACGFPVICTDAVCYRGDLPVTRVKNRFKDWLDAVRMHLADLDATARQGDALRERVLGEWMLKGENLQRWRSAWLPD